jgi:DnaJ-class molecular chaperone
MSAEQHQELTTLPPLESPCRDCHGKGWEWVDGDLCACAYCSGAGYVPTQIGQQVLDLMRHNFRPMLKETS